MRDASADTNQDVSGGGAAHRASTPVFGLRFSDLDEPGAARHMLAVRRTAAEGPGLFVTPNIQHIALARRDDAFRAAMAGAEIIVADGFPVYRFARARGVDLPGRVAGRAVIEEMFADPVRLSGHRGYFVVDSEATASGIRAWAARRAPDFVVETHVPPFGFEADAGYGRSLADAISAFDTTLLFLCIGAPKSEVFAHRYRAYLPPCWILCVGQSFRLLLGTTRPPPAVMVRLNLEWLWRIALEPRRMLARYGPSGVGFLRAALSDLRAHR